MIRVGTRGSALALAQARWVADRLGNETELVTITVAGDRGADVGDKSRWVSELERALLAGQIDLAVHSAKDVPAELAPGLELVAIPERADPRDAICGAVSLRALAPRARVGTSSLRRTAQIRAARSDLDVVPVRGNVDTRLRKLASGEFDALVLALAGLQRLGRADEASGVLDELVPAAGQGALALEARAGEAETGALAAALTDLSDPVTEACVGVERELVRALGASCNTPVGARARALADGVLELTAWIGLPDGRAYLRDELRGSAGPGLGLAVAERLTATGARELLAAAEAQVAAG
ncbi:MAG TPA: hydroxymethylbilane synthase [Solirubrobacteraceae bacterium]|nr:hydroxymethylbilane synthase [Solirubrobacteraceae bacterium]